MLVSVESPCLVCESGSWTECTTGSLVCWETGKCDPLVPVSTSLHDADTSLFEPELVCYCPLLKNRVALPLVAQASLPCVHLPMWKLD